MREIIEALYIEKSEIPDISWDFVVNFVTAFSPLAICTKHMQTEQYVIGDFYRDWLCCEIELEELVTKTPYASRLHESMQKKKQIFMDSDAFQAALYLDPRFNYENSTMLSENQKSTAAYLTATFERLTKLEDLQKVGNEPDSPNISCDMMFEFPTTSAAPYSKLQQRMTANITANTETNRTFKQKLIALASQKGVPLHTDILSYWKTSNNYKEIKKVAAVALAVPATQVSVERAFSALSLVLTKLRSRLSNSTINNLLITK
ncbi:uncharacterized protein LOC119675339, partial [Teleopsis dalmanni]|uniref:uncharacterized protein LOC119675339 n=1 Tax=Teleopsis dalmanni TaxID=139649 RepID=UPI0018CE6E35